MLTKQIQPGDEVWVLGCVSSYSKKLVKKIHAAGPIFKDRIYPEPWGNLFDSEYDVIEAMLNRAAKEVTQAEKDLANAQAKWKKLLNKYGSSPVTRPARS